jgi:hypothetical protein
MARRGRPRVKKKDQVTVKFKLIQAYIDPKLQSKIVRDANRNERTVAAQLRIIINAYYGKK